MDAERVPPAEPLCPPAVQLPPCWGAIIKGSPDSSGCTPGFSGPKEKDNVKFKDHFCPCCQDLTEVDASRVRALPTELVEYYRHDRAAGFWKAAAPSVGGGQFRLANHTTPCNPHPPKLVLYREKPPELQWAQMPPEWVQNGKVHFRVAKDTLVPVGAMGTTRTSPHAHNKRQKGAERADSSAVSPPPKPSAGYAGLVPSGPLSGASMRSSPDLQTSAAAKEAGSSSPTSKPTLNVHIPLAPLETTGPLSEVRSPGELTDPIVPDQPSQLASQLLPSYQGVVALLEASLQPPSLVRERLTDEQRRQLSHQLDSAKLAVACLLKMGGTLQRADSTDGPIYSTATSTPMPGRRTPEKKQRSSSGPARLNIFQQTMGILGSRRGSVSSCRGSAQDDSQLHSGRSSQQGSGHWSSEERRAYESRRDSQTDSLQCGSSNGGLRRGSSHDTALSGLRRGSQEELSVASHTSRSSRGSRGSRDWRTSNVSRDSRTSFADPVDDLADSRALCDPSHTILLEPSMSMTERKVTTVRRLGERALSDSNLLSKGASVKSLRRMFANNMANMFGKKGRNGTS